jgi:GNAT superfamily N-acetyltransferase
MSLSFVHDVWLTQTTSFPCYRLNGWGAEGGFCEGITKLAGTGKSFFYAKLPTTDVAGGKLLTRSGFAIVDTNVTLDLKDGAFNVNPSIIVGEAHAEQFKPLQNISACCFQYSRFHLDPLFPNELANLIKRRWVENYCNRSRGSALYAARIGNVIVGFLAVLVSGDSDERMAVIDLVGVAPEYQRRGVGAALVRHFVDSWAGRVAKLRVGTQIANIASLGFYQRCGFEIAESSYVFHGHYFDGVPVS